MKRISFFLALTLVIFSFGLASAEQSVHVIPSAGIWQDAGTQYINTNQTVSWDMRIINTNGLGLSYNAGFTYVIKSADASWTNPAYMDTLSMASQLIDNRSWGTLFASTNFYWWRNDGFVVQPNGSGEDTVGLSVLSFAPPAIFDGFDAVGLRVTIGPVPEADAGKTICLEQILNDITTSGYEGTWVYLAGGDPSTPNVDPGFYDEGGDSVVTGLNLCYEIMTQPDVPPAVTGPANLQGSHCALITGDYAATDPDGSDAITFSLDGAPAGATISAGGHFEWQPSLADVGTSISFNVVATESDGAFTNYAVNVVVENDAPVFASGCGLTYPASVGAEKTYTFTATDNCPGDPKTFFVADMGGAAGAVSFSGGVLSYTAEEPTGTFTWSIGVTDGVDTSYCEADFVVNIGATFDVSIEKTHNTPQGQFENVGVYLNNGLEIGGFNFLVAYDASALTFQGANVDGSPLYDDCGWEYFTYRFGPDGNCGSGCPSGLLRVVGIAETNNGPAHPTCWSADLPYLLFNMSFLVSNDRTLECSYVPIRFYWIECGDNTLSSVDGDLLYVSARVYENSWDVDNPTMEINVADPTVGFPTYQGAQTECLVSDKVEVQDDIDFHNGGVDIVCAKDVDDRGDINLDGLAYTIADAVMFTNYFIYGISAFDTHALGSIAASDINADGIALSVADLVYLIRVIVGDAQPYATGFLKPATVDAVYHINNGVVNVEEAMGAAVLHIAGDVTPVLLADNMEMKYAYNADKNVTSAIVYSLKNNNFTGDFIDARGDIIDIEMATAKGNPVNGQELPSNFALFQNYPNPFNPTTAISFALANASDYELTVYNLVGQVVTTFAGHGDAGTVTVNWDASNNASGVYFYKLTAGNFTATKKMVLLK